MVMVTVLAMIGWLIITMKTEMFIVKPVGTRITRSAMGLQMIVIAGQKSILMIFPAANQKTL